jgi:hypothetical protein
MAADRDGRDAAPAESADDGSFSRWNAGSLATFSLTASYFLLCLVLFAAYTITVLMMRYRPERLAQWVQDIREPASASPGVNVPYSANLFSTDEGGSWGVQQTNIATLRYEIVGKRMTVWFFINDTQVTGKPRELQIHLPASYASASRVRVPTLVYEAAAEKPAFANVEVGDTRIILCKLNRERWLGGSTDVYGQVTFDLQ